MKLHDLHPAAGAHRPRTRVGRGIAAGQGKTAGRGTKGQKARAGASIPAWFEGGQTPLSQRIPKLRGFRNRLKVQYEVVNVGRIAELVEKGRLQPGELPGTRAGAKKAPITINQDILRAAGLVRTLRRPMKVLGTGEVDMALFVVADAITTGARRKIEAAGGSVQLLEVPVEPTVGLGVDPGHAETSPTDERDGPAEPPDRPSDETSSPASAGAKAAGRTRARASAASDEPATTGAPGPDLESGGDAASDPGPADGDA